MKIGNNSGKVSLADSINGGWYIIDVGRDEGRSVVVRGGVDGSGVSRSGDEENSCEEEVGTGSGCTRSLGAGDEDEEFGCCRF